MSDQSGLGINYLVSIDDEGKLRWARNNVVIDTTEGKWQDLGEGKGIIPQDSTHPCPPIPPRRDSFGSTSFRSRQQNEATHYAGSKKGRNRLGRAICRHFTLKGRMDKLLRQTVGANTWIYVSVRLHNWRYFEANERSGWELWVIRVIINVYANANHLQSTYSLESKVLTQLGN